MSDPIRFTLDGTEVRRRMARLAQGEFSLVYVAPERLVFEGFNASGRPVWRAS